jgi:hypothetical protein
VGELRGADQAGLRRAITAQLALLGSLGGGASGGGGAGSGGRGPMAAALAAALARVKAGCSYGEFVAAARTLLAYVANLLDHPGDERYHRIKLSNAAFQSRLGCRAGGKECMAAIGFRCVGVCAGWGGVEVGWDGVEEGAQANVCGCMVWGGGPAGPESGDMGAVTALGRARLPGVGALSRMPGCSWSGWGSCLWAALLSPPLP